MRIANLVAVSLLAVACGGSGGESNDPLPLAPAPTLQLDRTADGWAAPPVEDALDRVSNNGAGYTGEIDRYAITIPADGRLQISLQWDHDADFDLLLAGDEAGTAKGVISQKTRGEAKAMRKSTKTKAGGHGVVFQTCVLGQNGTNANIPAGILSTVSQSKVKVTM